MTSSIFLLADLALITASFSFNSLSSLSSSFSGGVFGFGLGNGDDCEGMEDEEDGNGDDGGDGGGGLHQEEANESADGSACDWSCDWSCDCAREGMEDEEDGTGDDGGGGGEGPHQEEANNSTDGSACDWSDSEIEWTAGESFFMLELFVFCNWPLVFTIECDGSVLELYTLSKTLFCAL